MPTAGIWKSSWLPYTETFIRDQISHVPDWSVIKLGFTNLPESIDRADYAPYGATRSELLRRSIFGSKPYLDKYVRHLMGVDARLIHAHFGPGGVEALPLSRAAGLPLMTTFHGADAVTSHSRFPWVRSTYPRNLVSLFDESRKLIAVSSYIASMLIRSGAPGNKVEVLHTGTRPSSLQDVSERQGIVFVGRLIDIKGPMDLLRAMSLMPQSLREKTPVTIVGDGPLRRELELYANEMRLRVRFMGRLSSEVIPSVLRSHLLFCGPSRASLEGTREGFGMVFVEASLQQIPCVGYASGGVEESVQHQVTGLLAPEGDIPALSRYLSELLQDTSRAEAMGIEGRVRALRDFNLSEQASKLSELYYEVSL